MDRQRTIKTQISVRGIGLQTGKVVTLKIKPASPNTGIVFIRTDLCHKPFIEVKPSNLKEPGKFLQRTILKCHRAEVHTVEHLLAALSGFFVDNAIVEIDNVELPGLDGSAKEYARVLREAGFLEQDLERRYLAIEKPIICSNGKASIQIIPDDNFRVEYFLDYNHPMLREQWFDAKLGAQEELMRFFEEEVAPSRTFCREEEALLLLKAGLGKGADQYNTLVIGDEGPVDNQFRFDNEPARHKLLDF